MQFYIHRNKHILINQSPDNFNIFRINSKTFIIFPISDLLTFKIHHHGPVGLMFHTIMNYLFDKN